MIKLAGGGNGVTSGPAVKEINLASHARLLESFTFQERSRPLIFLEAERHYFLPLSAVRDFVDLVDLPRIRILQSYFSQRTAKEVLHKLARGEQHTPGHDQADILQVRVRESLDCLGGRRLELTTKFRARGQSSLEKFELSHPLSELEFNSILAMSDRGTVVKDRHLLVHNHAGENLTLELDVPLWCKRFGKQQVLKTLGYALIDVEVSSKTIMQQLRAGNHYSPLLMAAIDVSRDLPHAAQLRRPLSWKTLAKKGVTNNTESALKILKRLYQKKTSPKNLPPSVR